MRALNYYEILPNSVTSKIIFKKSSFFFSLQPVPAVLTPFAGAVLRCLLLHFHNIALALVQATAIPLEVEGVRLTALAVIHRLLVPVLGFNVLFAVFVYFLSACLLCI